MTTPFAERFAAVRERFGPLTLGADPHDQLLRKWGLPDGADGLERFADIIIAAASGTVGLIKPQSAFYERHGWRGIRTLTRLVETAADGIAVVALVGDQVTGRRFGERGDRFELRAVGRLTACEVEAEWQAGGITETMNFTGEPAPRAAKSLFASPPFAPAAETWPRPVVESML